MKNWKIVVLSLLIIIVGCEVSFAKTGSGAAPESKLKTVAIIEVKFSPFYVPILPLIDAASFKKKLLPLAGEIMEEEKKRVDIYRKNIAEKLGKYFQANIIYGTELQSNKKFPELYASYNDSSSWQTGNENFRNKIVSTGDINLIPLKFGKKQNCKEMIADICSKLEVDAVAVCSFNLLVMNAKMNSNPLNLIFGLSIIDKEGELILIVDNFRLSKAMEIVGDDIIDYSIKLDDYNTVIDETISKAAEKYQKKNK